MATEDFTTKDLVPFQFQQTVVSTLTDEAGTPWFLAVDVCAALSVKNVSQAIARLDPDEHSSICLNDGVSGARETLIINESGLYSLTLSSRKSVAKAFKRWVTHEVLPAIRKTGAYTVNPPPALPELHDPAYQLLVKTVCDLDATRHQLALLEARERERDKALIATQQKMIEGFLLAEQADTKATLALEDARRMSLEDFVLSNGLLRQFPVTQWPHIATWLRRFCQQWGLEVIKTAVPGKLWKDENTYPLSAIGAWYRQELHRPRQITLLKEAPDGAPTA
jgi:prophage antirepressor-like protein